MASLWTADVDSLVAMHRACKRWNSAQQRMQLAWKIAFTRRFPLAPLADPMFSLHRNDWISCYRMALLCERNWLRNRRTSTLFVATGPLPIDDIALAASHAFITSNPAHSNLRSQHIHVHTLPAWHELRTLVHNSVRGKLRLLCRQTPEGDRLISFCDVNLVVWSVDSMSQLHALDFSSVMGDDICADVAFAPSKIAALSMRGFLFVYDLVESSPAIPQPTAMFCLPATADSLFYSLAWQSDTRYLVFAREDCEATLAFCIDVTNTSLQRPVADAKKNIHVPTVFPNAKLATADHSLPLFTTRDEKYAHRPRPVQSSSGLDSTMAVSRDGDVLRLSNYNVDSNTWALHSLLPLDPSFRVYNPVQSHPSMLLLTTEDDLDGFTQCEPHSLMVINTANASATICHKTSPTPPISTFAYGFNFRYLITIESILKHNAGRFNYPVPGADRPAAHSTMLTLSLYDYGAPSVLEEYSGL